MFVKTPNEHQTHISNLEIIFFTLYISGKEKWKDSVIIIRFGKTTYGDIKDMLTN